MWKALYIDRCSRWTEHPNEERGGNARKEAT